MSTLKIRVQKRLIGPDAASGAIADVIPISDSGGTTAYRGLVVPVGSQQTHSLEVPPGEYLVRASLPSGSLLSMRTSVASDETKEAFLQAEESSHEWLGWQSLIGKQHPPRMRKLAGFDPKLSLVVVRPGGGRWSAFRQLLRQPAPISTNDIREALASDPVETDLQPTDRDGWMSSFRVDIAALNLPHDRLCYAIIERGDVIDLACLPGPWDTKYGAAQLDIAVPHDADERIGVVIPDQQLGALLGYIAAGQLPLAEELGKEGTAAHKAFAEALHGKVTNPFAAVIGAHLLLQTDPRPQVYWHGWIQTLAQWFPWLPDGAALLGSLRLKLAKSYEDVALARQSFEEATERGIPVFGPVLRQLLEGVSTIVEDPDADSGKLKERLPAIRSVASLLRTDQAFTMLHFEART